MDPYSVLGLKHGASEHDAKEAFRKLAKTCHPDLHPNDATAEHRFKEINAAYDAIKNPQPEAGFRWQTFHSGSPFESQGQFDDIFAQVFRPRNADAVIEIKMTLEEAFVGKEVSVAVPIGKATRNATVTLPPGIAHGMRVRVPQGGHQSHPGITPGDLYLLASIAHHERFLRQVNNLHTTVPVSVFDVLLTRDIEVVGIDGQIMRVSIPDGFDSRKLRLAGKGMPDPHNGVCGDLLISLFIEYPSLTDEQRSLIEQASKGS